MNSTTTIITGSAGGIGAATARVLAASGRAVALLDRSLEGAEAVAAAIRGSGGDAMAFAADVADQTSLEAALDAVELALPPVTEVVTAAGVIRNGGFLSLPVGDWERTIQVNLTGTWLTMQRVARRLVARGTTGSFVALSSVAGRGPRANAVDYAASKAGVISVCRSAAVALAEHGIRVNAVCPGVVDTPMTKAIHDRLGRDAGITPEESLDRLLAQIPLGTLLAPTEIAGVIEFLLSDRAGYITGQSINVCGGLEFD